MSATAVGCSKCSPAALARSPSPTSGSPSAGESFALLAVCFILAGVGIGLAETAETAAVAQFAPEHLRGSAFGTLAGLQAVGNLAASAIAGVLWTAVSPAAAFVYVAAWMVLALAGLLFAVLPRRAPAA